MKQSKRDRKIHMMLNSKKKHHNGIESFKSKTTWTEKEKMKMAKMNKMKYKPKHQTIFIKPVTR